MWIYQAVMRRWRVSLIVGVAILGILMSVLYSYTMPPPLSGPRGPVPKAMEDFEPSHWTVVDAMRVDTYDATAHETLRLLYWQAPSSLNPHLPSVASDLDISRAIYEPLASFDKDGNLVPLLAAEIPTQESGDVAPDGKSVVWKLKENVKWADGTPFTAEDVRFTAEFIADPQTGAVVHELYQPIESVKVLDPHTVQINFKTVQPAWDQFFVGTQGVILPKHIFAAYTGERARQAPANWAPVGTGPYQVVDFRPEEALFLGNKLLQTNRIVLEPNPHYREEGKPFFKRVEVKGGGTVDGVIRRVMRTGDVDFAWQLYVEAETLSQIENSRLGRTIITHGPWVEQLALNWADPNRETESGERANIKFKHPFFSDKQVRQAFSYAIDRESIALLYGEAGQATANVVVAPARYQSPNTSYEFDLQKAQALLTAAGWVDSDGDGVRDKGGVPMRVVFQTVATPLQQKAQQIIKAALEQIGVEVELKLIDSSTFFGDDPSDPNTRRHFYADIELFSNGNNNPDPGPYLWQWTCDQIPQQSNNWTGENVARWCNPEYDKLYEQSKTELDPEKRRDLFIQMNDILVEAVVMIPITLQREVSGASHSLLGLAPTPWDSMLWNIQDWRRETP